MLAGGGVGTVVGLGVSMTFLQFAIGALNDVVDAPADAGRRPPKPIPSGVISSQLARVVSVMCAAAGLVLAALSGPAILLLGILVLAIGAAYDLAAKGTPWSWLPFAIGIPVLPVFGWLGATDTLPSSFGVLIPMAVLAGTGLAIANALADLETDGRSGTRSVATALGRERSWWMGALSMIAATALGVTFLGRGGWTLPIVALVVGGTAVIVAGLALARRSQGAARRRGWETQAVGAAIAATGWVAGILPGP